MQPLHFDTALENILAHNDDYEAEAYVFLKEALDYTVALELKKEQRNSKHVSAKDLLYGFKDYSLKEYGPMAATLLAEWGIKNCSDIGNMVFLLIAEGMFGKQDSDSREDFIEYFSFDDVFVTPFLPKKLIIEDK